MFFYNNLGGASNVEAYKLYSDYILVKFFGTTKIYKYSYDSAGVAHVEEMKRLACAGYGLNSYINKHVRNLYER